ncbi:metallophosphoesterase [Pedobacter riviphilus]|uniref:Metallophosphoesterase n=1 Tax=Pedobacter riviphilus TaxID=2766984 RepID=A0ABX6TLP5_9SPHI|nr:MULTISPECIES: metallophosphoesterase [Pedobacter]NII82731.1 Icc-related predicted phosphoesterase [Pedobacter sp. SG908]NMN36749.1 Icc-related predicted phosphoesterase [Pedobacter sp. SG918]QNR86444.1 metallophosphoesterase [Pedobacter riviphilus]
MKAKIISDLHQEFGISDLDFSNADIVILAGDTNLGTSGIEWVKKNISDKPVIYLLGNHEYYKGSYPKTLNQILEASLNSNITVLENKRFEFENIRFHGATLWTDFSLFGSPVEYGIICQGQMNDYRQIRKAPSFSKLRSIDTYKIHQASKLWLEESLEESIGYKNVVITHHAPSIKSIPDLYKNDPISSAYASNLEDIIIKYQPDYWIHGHIHTPVRYKIGKTEIICNPHGYLSEQYNGYDKDLIIEI